MAMRLKVVGSVAGYACGLAAVCAIVLADSPAGAQTTYYWTTSPSSIVGSSGTWDSSTPNWTQNYPGGGGNVHWVTAANAQTTIALDNGYNSGNVEWYLPGYQVMINVFPTPASVLSGARHQSTGRRLGKPDRPRHGGDF